MINPESLEHEVPHVPYTFVHELVDKHLWQEESNLRLINLSEQRVLAPGFGVYIDENKYAIVAGEPAGERRYAVTDRLRECTALAMHDPRTHRGLLAHVYQTRAPRELLRRFAHELGDPENLSLTIIPGFNHSLAGEERIEGFVEESLSLGISSLALDIAHGQPGTERGVLQDVMSGQVAELSLIITPEQKNHYNTNWATSI